MHDMPLLLIWAAWPLGRVEMVAHHSLESPEADLLPLLEYEHHELQTFSLHKELPACCLVLMAYGPMLSDIRSWCPAT